nr:hypothetical protein [Tanacetum cinerariifolium]
SVGASEAEEVSAEEPQVAEEDTDFQKAAEESMKDAYALRKGPLPPVVIREPESGKCQAGPNPSNAEARIQSTSSPVVHAGSDREHMDTDVANVSLQPSTEQLYEGFTATIYPNVQENLKLAVEEPVLLEEPASSSGTLSSLQHLSRDLPLEINSFVTNLRMQTKVHKPKLNQCNHYRHNNNYNHNVTTTTSSTTKHDRGDDGKAYRASGSQVTPPPPPPPTSTNQDSPSTGSATPSPAKTVATTEHQAWATPDGRRPALSISKMKAAYYPDVGLEEMVPDQFWIEKESVQRVHVRNSEAFEDTENLSQLGELCWRTHKRGKLQIVEAYRLIKLLQHYRPLSDDL